MSVFEYVDLPTWLLLAVAFLVPNALLFLGLYWTLSQIYSKLRAFERQLRDSSYRWDADILRIEAEITSAIDECSRLADTVKGDVSQLRSELDENLYELGATIMHVEEHTTHLLTREHVSGFASKAALYTLRADLEKLTAEVVKLRERHRTRTPTEQQHSLDNIHIERQSAEESLQSEGRLTMLKQQRRIVALLAEKKDPPTEAERL